MVLLQNKVRCKVYQDMISYTALLSCNQWVSGGINTSGSEVRVSKHLLLLNVGNYTERRLVAS